jgi:hypothetical protein
MEVTNIDFSALLNMVDTFYNNAWNRLIVLLAIAGVVWPLILKVYSDYRVRIKEEKLEKKFSEKIQKLNESNLELINKKNDANMEKLDKLISEQIENVEMKLNTSMGGVFHVQGNVSYEKKQDKDALTSYFKAFHYYYDGKNEQNLQIVINNIIKCYTQIKDLPLLIEVESQHVDLINKLLEINENSRYGNTIDKIKKAFNTAKKRLEK